MIEERYPGYGGDTHDHGFQLDSTGMPVGFEGTNTVMNKSIYRPIFVNDQTFKPFGDPDQPPEVRRQRLQQMLAGVNMSEQQYNEKVQAKRSLAVMHQSFQPQLLNPRDPLGVDQLGPQVWTNHLSKDSYITPSEQVQNVTNNQNLILQSQQFPDMFEKFQNNQQQYGAAGE